MKEYAIYPFKIMNISQNWNQGNHIPHWKDSKDHSDKPWDEAGNDSNRSYFEPQNDFIIEEILGLNNNITNTVRLKSVNKLYIPYKETPDYLYITLAHMNEDNLKQLKKGQVLKKRTKILLEGNDGFATGNHFHITANLGKYYGFLKNSNGSWCYTYEKSLIPEEAFYVDKSFTTIKNSNGSIFKNIPITVYGTPVSRNELIDQIEILTSNVRIRNMPSISNGNILGYIKKGIYNISETDVAEGYTWYKIDDNWVAFSNECAQLLSKIPEEVIIDEKPSHDIEPKKGIFKRIFNSIINFFKKIFNS